MTLFNFLLSFIESATSLSKETNLDFRKYEVCDNVDLETILLEYESYYFVKFKKYPRITKMLPSIKIPSFRLTQNMFHFISDDTNVKSREYRDKFKASSKKWFAFVFITPSKLLLLLFFPRSSDTSLFPTC